MMSFIDLQRRFHHVTAKELEEPDHLVYFSESEFGSRLGWDALLEYARVVLLAEEGAGKTKEMTRQANRLVEEGKHGFFIALESLTSATLVDSLSPDEEQKFHAWKSDGQSPAWFFLDAVDELKLKQGKLERALLRLSRELHGHLDRARVIISCRPSDWCQTVDMAILQQRLPLPATREAKLADDPSESFLKVLRKNDRHTAASGRNGEDEENAHSFKTVVLLPLGRSQIEIYAQQSGVTDSAAFLAELDLQNAWTFARRPKDINDLITVWTCERRLGTRSEQHEANIQAKLKDRSDPTYSGTLTEIQAREGAERLALALALTRNLTVRSLDQSIDLQRAGRVLDSAKILQDWTEQQRQALLRRALFDTATYGRIRFHHRSVQEYLAAKRLLRLREQGMTTKALCRLLFAERYGVQVARPSMRVIAAWLSLWDENIRRELTKREPEVLLSFGDPAALNLSARSDLLREFATAYGQGGWRGHDIPIDEVRRLAHPGLAPVIRELWGGGPANDDVRQLLIELIQQGRITECVDLAHAAALETAWSDYHRISAIKAVLACGETQRAKELAADIIARSESWSDRIVHHIAPFIFPDIISVEELIALVERTPESESTSSGFYWALLQIAQSIEPWSHIAVALRDSVADLIWQGRFSSQDPYDVHSKYDHLKPGLACLCEKQTRDHSKITQELIRACVIANRFGEQTDGNIDSVAKIKKKICDFETFRSQVFWTELALMDEVSTVNNDLERLVRTEHEGLLGDLIPADCSWLLKALEDESRPERRSVALLALLQFWQQQGRDPLEIERLREALKGDTVLEAIFVNNTTPPKFDEELENLNRKHLQYKHDQEAKEKKRLDDWKRWREEVLADPGGWFSEEKQEQTLINLHKWLVISHKSWNNYRVWNKDVIVHSFGLDFAERAERAFRSCWRSVKPVLWSERPLEERSTIRNSWLRGLCGLYAEACYPGWSTLLTADEAKIAAAYAMVELNGFAPFITDLTNSNPVEVEAVLGNELKAEFEVCVDYDHPPIFQDLVYATDNVKQLLAPRLLSLVRNALFDIAAEISPRLGRHLDCVFRVLRETIHGSDRKDLALECAKRFHVIPTSPLGVAWLKGIFDFDVELGVQTFLDYLAGCKSHKATEHVIMMFGAIFGEKNSINLNVIGPAPRAHYLCQLVRNAYRCIRREEDQVHLGTYTPNFRDEAETARNSLLSALLETPGPEAYGAILQLATESDFAHFPDRLRQYARERAARDAEPPAYRPEDVTLLEQRFELPPGDMEGLFSVMMDRLDDLQHDISHHDFSDRRTLRTISEEEEMQRTLALRIDAKSKGAFSVNREDEVADRKRTDIRLTTASGHKAVIEVKLADKRWSLTDFEMALSHQLVGQYLRHDTCKAGCLLLTYDGQKKYWVDPLTRKHLKFPAMVSYLAEKAKELEKAHKMRIRLAVFGMDLTDPYLEPAHKSGGKGK